MQAGASTMRDFPRSICSGTPRVAPWPTYRRASMLDLMRGERKVREAYKALEATIANQHAQHSPSAVSEGVTP